MQEDARMRVHTYFTKCRLFLKLADADVCRIMKDLADCLLWTTHRAGESKI